MAIAAGAPILASDIILATRRVIARGNRTSTKTMTSVTAGTETGILQINNISLQAGTYPVFATNIRGDSTTDTDIIACKIRYSTSGNATTSSTELCKAELTDQRTAPIYGLLTVASTATYSFLLSGLRATGASTATITWYGTADGGTGMNLYICDGGADPGDTGVDI